MAFIILNKPIPQSYGNLNDDQKKAIVDIFVFTNNPKTVKNSKTIADLDGGHYIPSDICTKYFKKIKGIISYCNNLMTGEVTEPQSLAELKSIAFTNYPDCSQIAFDYLIDKMIENSTVEGTFDAYKYYFDNLNTTI